MSELPWADFPKSQPLPICRASSSPALPSEKRPDLQRKHLEQHGLDHESDGALYLRWQQKYHGPRFSPSLRSGAQRGTSAAKGERDQKQIAFRFDGCLILLVVGTFTVIEGGALCGSAVVDEFISYNVLSWVGCLESEH
jgi:hypothetical protein